MKKQIVLATGILLSLLGGFSQGIFAEELATYTLDPINVTAQGYAKSNLETPADTQVYKAAELKKTGARDVISALKYKNGINYTNMGPNDQSWITGNSGTNLRGIDNGTLVLLNGVPVSFNNVSHLDMMNLDTVDRVEVVKGGGAILYGSEAFGGVINVITKDVYKNSVHVGLGNQGQRDYAATVGAGKLGVAVGRSKYGHTGNMTDAKSKTTINGKKVPYAIGFGDSQKDHVDVSYKFNDNLHFNYMYNKKEYSIDYNDVNEKLLHLFNYDDTEHFTQLRYNDKSGWDANLFYNYRMIDNPDYFMASPQTLEWEKSYHKQYGTNIKKVWKNDVSTALLGATIKRQTYKDDNQKYKIFSNSASPLKPVANFGQYGMNEYSVLGSYDRKLSPVTNVIASMRQDWVTSSAGDYNAFLPQFQAITKLNEQSSLYASAGKFFRMPTFRNLYYASAVMVPNPNLKPEKGWNYEAGYKYDNNKDTTFTVALFNTNIDDQIVSVKDSANISYQTNAAQYRNTGLEVSYAHDLNEHFTYNLGFTVGNPQRKYKSGQEWQRALGRYQMTGGLNYNNKDTELGLNLSYAGDRVYNSTSNEKVSYTEISGNLLTSNLHAGYKFTKNIKGTFDIDNLFNRKDYTSNGTYYTMGRTWMAGVTYTF